MRHAWWVLLVFLLTGCSFVTSSRTPLFTSDDFAAPVSPGLYEAADGTRVTLGTSGRRLLVRLTEPSGKVSTMAGGAVPTRFPGYFVLQLMPADAATRQVAYVPVRVRGDDAWVLVGPCDNDPLCDETFIRHGFVRDSLGWSHPAQFTRSGLVAFYDDLLGGIAGDRRMSGDSGLGPYGGILFHKTSD